jgi:predicted glycoside hydrolase/deacetylase ChbG (UPF0249 family)
MTTRVNATLATVELSSDRSEMWGAERMASGALIVNADDWGRDRPNTDRTLECVLRGAVTSVSAMVFMEDSVRAAAIARESGVDAGLHLNLTTPFSMSGCAAKLADHQRRLDRYVRYRKFASIVYHPVLTNSFEYVVAAQLEEFRRLYGADADRIDGHHHMHLCANVVLARLLPQGTMVRRNFTFGAGEKNPFNRRYRQFIDGVLAKRHRLTDMFFSLPPMEPRRLERIFSAASDHVVELETHPVNAAEHRFLAGGEIFDWAKVTKLQSFRSLAPEASLLNPSR